MKLPRLISLVLLFSLCAMGLLGCSKKAEENGAKNNNPVESSASAEIVNSLPAVVATCDKSAGELSEFRNQARTLYNNRKFDELEELADKLRTTKALFPNGSWMLYRFYEAQDCRDNEPESMWELHAQIHNAWITAKPQSITARVAFANFLVKYAWHARGTGYANTVSKTGWQQFEERLADARKVLDDAASLKEKCPMWWRVKMTIALGQGWDRAQYEKLFAEAKAAEPGFWSYDVARAYYLLPRWHGEPGDWEAAASAEAKRPGGLGVEGYTRVIIAQSVFYNNIFKETKASWPDTRKGFEVLRKKYPDSLQILSDFCLMACLSKDRALAKQLFSEIGGRMETDIWQKKDDFIECRNWAYSK